MDQASTIEIEVGTPITFQGGNYALLTLREPRAGEVRRAEGQMRTGVNAETARLYAMHLVAMVSGWPIPVIEQLPISVLNRASSYLNRFLDSGPETGPN